MNFQSPISVSEIAERINATIVGNKNILATGLNEIHKVELGSIIFVGHEKYLKKALYSEATVIIVNTNQQPPEGKCFLIHESPFAAYNSLVAHFYPFKSAFGKEMISQETEIHESAQIHTSVVIGNGVTIGKNCIIYPNVVIYDNTHIGDNVIIQSGAIIGGQAFYYDKKGGDYIKWISCGWVQIEDDVEIGANTTIDKGVSGITRIGKGTKIDNLVHIGHGVEIGKNCLIAAQCGIGGKTIIEDDVICWGQVGITKDIRIGKGAVISAQSGVSKSLEGGKAYYGSPAREIRTVHKELAALRRVPDLIDKLESKAD
ncbi:MAG: UDP-3-O-(3-hydroxymyristoyl)glucosamine N-acyltransferase [Bacteroidetes bacterium]|nr:UDP-3-O-(3-hydroxymyristoyl)glucosamine N-acyltransferase [Bacteroidota bacterium]